VDLGALNKMDVLGSRIGRNCTADPLKCHRRRRLLDGRSDADARRNARAISIDPHLILSVETGAAGFIAMSIRANLSYLAYPAALLTIPPNFPYLFPLAKDFSCRNERMDRSRGIYYSYNIRTVVRRVTNVSDVARSDD